MAKRENIPSQTCPRCSYPMDTADTMIDDAEPSPGDITVCLNCGDLLEFGPDLITRLPKDEVAIYLEASPEQLRTIKLSQYFIKRRGRIR